jgi:hypothetical protein
MSRPTSTRPLVSRMAAAVVEAWADMRYANRRIIEKRMGIGRSTQR